MTQDRSPADFMHVCLRWHEAFNKMEIWRRAGDRALQGAVVGGGLELASSAHVRVMDQKRVFRAFPKASVVCSRAVVLRSVSPDLVGKARMIDIDADGPASIRGKRRRFRVAQYIVEGSSMDKAMELARQGRPEPAAV